MSSGNLGSFMRPSRSWMGIRPKARCQRVSEQPTTSLKPKETTELSKGQSPERRVADWRWHDSSAALEGSSVAAGN
ncbi:hypothetical protein NL676_027949 [Syzygium grande]|nr:hypothetical protein NL676_027949 [Syzygium grande]